MENEEIYKDIVNYEDMYQVSNNGKIKSLQRKVPCRNGFRAVNEKLLKLGKDKDNYIHVVLTKNNKKKTHKVHRLVYSYFNGVIPDGYTVNHIDGDKLNNENTNLEVLTNVDNLKHAHKNGLIKYAQAKDIKSSIKIIQLTIKGLEVAKFDSIHQASKRTKIDRKSIKLNIDCVYKQAGGYVWKLQKTML